MHRLNLWHRLGIVLTVIWVAGATYFYAQEISAARLDAAQQRLNFCLLIAQDDVDKRINCWTVNAPLIEPNHSEVWISAALAAVLPVPVAWLVAWALIWTAKWVLAGRNRKPV